MAKQRSKNTAPARKGVSARAGKPSPPQLRWLSRGKRQAGGKLPLFDDNGQKVSERTIRSCIDKGWAEPWFANPLKPDWLVCKLTDSGRRVLSLS